MIQFVNVCHLLYRWDTNSIVCKYPLRLMSVGNFCKEENLKVQQGFSYHIKDDFFEMIKDKYLMSNKEDGNYRPHFYAVQDKKNLDLYWMIPISSQVEKYKEIIEKKKQKYGKCNTIVIGKFAGCTCYA